MTRSLLAAFLLAIAAAHPAFSAETASPSPIDDPLGRVERIRPWLAHGSGGGGGSSPLVLPGATQPTYNNATSTSSLVKISNANYATLTPASHGSPAANGYSIRGWAQWDAISLYMVKGCQQVGLLPVHMPTDAEKTVGVDNNVADVKVRIDEGAWYTISGPTVNVNAGGTTDWNFTVCDSSYADGLHKVDAVVEPSTGPDIIMQGPAFDTIGKGFALIKARQVFVDSGTRGTPGHILYVPSNSTILNYDAGLTSAISYGMSVTTVGVAAGTFIDGDSANNVTACVAETGSNCTGAGAGGTYHLTGPSQLLETVFTGKIDNNGAGGSGNTLTVTAVSQGTLSLINPNTGGATIDGSGVTLNSQSNGSNANSQNLCSPSCTGGGWTGTYHLDTASTVASRTLYASVPATFNDETSYYFITNHGGALKRPTVYWCDGTCTGVSGSDSNSGVDAAHPLLTMGKVLTIAPTQDNGTTFHNGKWGEVVCVMKPAGMATYSGSLTTYPDATLGYVEWQNAHSGPDCTAPSDPGTVILSQNPATTTASWLLWHTAWRYIGMSTPANSFNAGNPMYLVADHATETVDGQGNSGLFGANGWAAVESTVFFGGLECVNGTQCVGTWGGLHLARNNLVRYEFDDCFHDTPVVIGNVCDAAGVPSEWLTATYHSASPRTATNVTVLPSDLTGRTLASIVDQQNLIGYSLFDATGNNCFGAGVAAGIISQTTTTVTLDTFITPTGVCVDGSTVYLSIMDGHPDDFQVSGGWVFHNVIVKGNDFGPNLGGGTQAVNLEEQQEDGIYIAGNTFRVNPPVNAQGHMLITNGGNYNTIFANNIWVTNNALLFDGSVGSTNVTMVHDTCLAGGSILPGFTTTGGGNVRALQAPSNICYSTTTP